VQTALLPRFINTLGRHNQFLELLSTPWSISCCWTPGWPLAHAAHQLHDKHTCYCYCSCTSSTAAVHWAGKKAARSLWRSFEAIRRQRSLRGPSGSPKPGVGRTARQPGSNNSHVHMAPVHSWSTLCKKRWKSTRLVGTMECAAAAAAAAAAGIRFDKW